MKSFVNKWIIITGASSGIGEASAYQFASAGANLILLARRSDRLTSQADALTKKFNVNVHTFTCDVRDQSAIKDVIENISALTSHIDILVNNAGLALSTDKIQDGNPGNWDTMIDTNLKGLLYMTHAVLPLMLNQQDGHIINIGSIAATEYYPGGNVYAATKHAVKAISQSLRIDLMGTGVRVTEIDPGAVETEFSIVRWNDVDRAKTYYTDFTPLVARDIADAVFYAATRPKHVTIAEMLILPTDQASANHIHRTVK